MVRLNKYGKSMISTEALWAALLQIRADESVGAPVAYRRKVEALSHLISQLGELLDTPLSLALESVDKEGAGMAGFCDSTTTAPNKVPSFSVAVLLTANTDAAPEPLVVTAVVFYYLGHDRITFPQRDYVWFTFEVLETEGAPTWHFHGWEPDVYGEYANW